MADGLVTKLSPSPSPAAASTADFRRGVLTAVNHSGDSDSTGSIAGNLLGAAGGVDALPPRVAGRAQSCRDVIEELGRDAACELRGDPPTDEHGEPTEEWFAKYPGA